MKAETTPQQHAAALNQFLLLSMSFLDGIEVIRVSSRLSRGNTPVQKLFFGLGVFVKFTDQVPIS